MAGYRHIQEYEEEMLELKAQGMTVREIGERYGLKKSKHMTFLRDITESNERSQQE